MCAQGREAENCKRGQAPRIRFCRGNRPGRVVTNWESAWARVAVTKLLINERQLIRAQALWKANDDVICFCCFCCFVVAAVVVVEEDRYINTLLCISGRGGRGAAYIDWRTSALSTWALSLA